MKKKYITPGMKVGKISPVSMLCTSNINLGRRHNGPGYDYIEGWVSDDGYGYSDQPD